jgi:hypothetical protein
MVWYRFRLAIIQQKAILSFKPGLLFGYVVVNGVNYGHHTMTPSEKIQFKNTLKQLALAIIEQRIDTARQAADSAQQAANQEEKSSAGDKYETGRAMGHLQKDMHAGQLAAHLKDLATLQAVNTDTLYAAPRNGAFISCSGFSFFIAAGLGRQLVNEQTIFFISPYAPLARLLEEKRAGDSFPFNGVTTVITDIY